MIGLVMAASWPVAAECVGSTVRDQKRRAAFVFEGTVRRLTVVEGSETAAVIETHRVWKGKVTTEVSVHFVPSSEGPLFTVGNRYVMFGVPETEARRKVYRLPSGSHDGTIWVDSCSGPFPVSPELIKQLGRSRKPSSSAVRTMSTDAESQIRFVNQTDGRSSTTRPLLLRAVLASTPAQPLFGIRTHVVSQPKGDTHRLL